MVMKRIGLVLSGGGARGRVLKACLKNISREIPGDDIWLIVGACRDGATSG